METDELPAKYLRDTRRVLLACCVNLLTIDPAIEFMKVLHHNTHMDSPFWKQNCDFMGALGYIKFNPTPGAKYTRAHKRIAANITKRWAEKAANHKAAVAYYQKNPANREIVDALTRGGK